MKHQPFIHILSVCLLFLSHTASGYAQSETLAEKLIVQKAVNLMEQGHYAESRALLEKIPETGTAYHIARYETAFSYILEKDYRKALKELKRIKEPGSLEWKYYQLLGSTYHYLEQEDKALDTFNEGLEAYPRSGMLYLERGMMKQRKQLPNEALSDYEKGIEAEPMFPSNYYRASQLFALGSSEPVWALMYGEIMVNLIPDHPRADEISRLMYNCLQQNVTRNDSAFQIKLTQDNTLHVNPKDSTLSFPFPALYQLYFNHAAKAIKAAPGKSIDFHTLCRIREKQILLLNAQDTGGHSPKNVLFDYLGRIIEAGHFEAYMMYTFKKQVPELYRSWLAGHQEELSHLKHWRKACPLSITLDNAFYRDKYAYVDFIIPTHEFFNPE